ncbi:helicase-related protein [Aeromicrobium panaciterrae]|uniref:helicase-related protein n=1 Tax=Aeromicrobium panaciterrae TaxID=363861 RepID=UPI0031DFC440
MTLTDAQATALTHIRSAYAGPEQGADEIVYNGRPNLLYSVGILFPSESGLTAAQTEVLDAAEEVIQAEVPEGEVEDPETSVPLAEDWRPSSTAISFVTSGPSVLCDFRGGTYESIDTDGPPQWQRTPFSSEGVELSPDRPPVALTLGHTEVQIGSRWRRFGDAYLVTVHARVMSGSTGDPKLDAGLCLYQVDLSVRATAEGRFLEYDTTSSLDSDPESAELRLRYRDRKAYAVGHGMAADWELSGDICTRVYLNPVPWFVVPAVETVAFDPSSVEGRALRLDLLAQIDSDPEVVTAALAAFVDAFAKWVQAQELRATNFGESSDTALDIVGRSKDAARRMNETLIVLQREDQKNLRTAFALAMAAMRLQMRQAQASQGHPLSEPTWRPFQLGFILVALASSVEDRHQDRELVDLIWFPTGGGKTEAYLGLAAIEMFRRRLEYGPKGGGTAVITRYTLRLLTAQQFHRSSSLICAMELLRRPDRIGDPRAQGMAPFTIGLWVGNEVTPGTRTAARQALDRLLKAARPEEANQFQIESCPWCGHSLLPTKHTGNESDYGIRRMGNDVDFRCTNATCEFQEGLPVSVVDEDIYADPPTFLLATVDKFARLQFRPESGRLLGLGTPFRQPSLIIQDELHLLSGPLGTTVAVFDAVIQMLLSREGSAPKIIASTATIRASEDQVRGLYGRRVALYPPSGLDDDRNFFSKPDSSGEGRLYVGLMPQSTSQASAVIAAAAPLLELPQIAVSATAGNDAYWTAVMYHNSLRELGRTGTLVVDDVNARLEARADRLGIQFRRIRPDRVLELTSRRRPEDLPNDLRELGRGIDTSEQAVDVVLSSNMLSVGIDVPRLALMLMVGQPKTTAEYIQATSRVGRGDVKGIVTTLFRSNRARDRSHFETFRSYHESLYRTVEPTSVTPWSLASRDRSLAGALVLLVRHSYATLSDNSAALNFRLDDPQFKESVEQLVGGLKLQVANSDDDELDETVAQIWSLLRDWNRRASAAREAGTKLPYERTTGVDASLLKRFEQPGEGWMVADSMRSVEPSVVVEVREPMEGGN